MWRSIASNALTLMVVGLVTFAGLLAWGQREYTGPGPMAQAVCFQVEKGTNLGEVSRLLESKGVISDARILRIGAGYTEKGGSLKFGSYLLPANVSMSDALGILTAGGQSTCGREVNYRIGVTGADIVLRELDAASNSYTEVAKFDPAVDPIPAQYKDADWMADVRYRVTLAEGVTSWQVVQSLRAADFLAGDIAEVPPEGTLSPDSYEVKPKTERAEILADMGARQTATLAELWASRAKDLPYKTPQEALIMASIVEKETGIATERARVASIFINRLAEGMKLQTDPTVIYGVTKGEGILGRGLRQSELKRETPWNTYVIDGLPATPIANPGRDSIAAALNPDTTKYLFFVADGTGGHAFAETLKEHNINVAKWREIEAQQTLEAEKKAQ
jgi:UPF0755 protein